MSDLTKEETLSKKETRIKKLIATDKSHNTAFHLVQLYYSLDNHFKSSVIIYVLQEIYINDYDKPIWRLACDCNISRTILFKYRHKIIDNIEKLLNPNIVLPDLSEESFSLKTIKALIKQLKEVFNSKEKA